MPGNEREGSGLGLALVARIAQRYGGSVAIAKGLDGKGLGVIVRWPAWRR